MKKRGKFHTRSIRHQFGGALRGFSAQRLSKQRGLKGATLGPANAGRRLSAEERRAIEEKMRDEGLL